LTQLTQQIRNEYPRPQFERSSWLNLNGEWEFEYDDAQIGDKEKWYLQHDFQQRIQVPFCYQSALSGIGETDFHDIVWYRKQLKLPADFVGKRIILHFGAVDYLSWIWVNGQLVKYHEGGHTSFEADITDAVQEGENSIVVKVQDFSKDVTLPRGKQYWREKSEFIFYTRTTGIWQTVWMEAVPDIYLDKVMFTPDIDLHEINICSFVNGNIKESDVRLKVGIWFKGELVTEDLYQIKAYEQSRTIKLHDLHDYFIDRRLWSPENPNLYDVEFSLIVDSQETDQVKSYFGMRKISVEDGKLCLNNHPYYMKLVLDQGYFPDGLLTPPSDDAIRQDVELTKAMGFNGARKHQKVEDPRYLYWCDRLGLLVWGEMANAYHFSRKYVNRITAEWQEVIARDYNHPCIVVWVPLNESWGVPNIATDRSQQQHALAMYYLTKALDPTRLVISNDGWEHVQSDICSMHDYEWRTEILEDRYSHLEKALEAMPCRKKIHVGGYSYQGEPVIVSEFGGISFKKSDWEGWGYSGAVNEEDFLDRLQSVCKPIMLSGVLQGFCYTQLTDVEQEINGLLTYDRKPKVPLEKIKEIITR
jgi:beta-galactosidase/beta-glucuronidase